MKDELVKFKTAILAKEKGFDITCSSCCSLDGSYYYREDPYSKLQIIKDKYSKRYFNPDIVPSDKRLWTPTQSLLQRWLREVYGIIVVALPYTTTDQGINPTYIWIIYKISASTKNRQLFTTYEEALEDGLYEALKLIEDE